MSQKGEAMILTHRLAYTIPLVLVLFCPGRAAWGEETLWQERAESASPVLPRGYSPLPSLSTLITELKPAVVNIHTTQVIKPRMRRSPFPRDPFLEEFFGPDPYEQFFGAPRGEMKTRSLGSGFIISPDGYIITNHHVVRNATEIRVRLADERTYKAKVVGGDQKTDVALLKVNAKGRLPTVYLGDSDKLEVGDWVIAIGNPFGLGHTVTAGIISGKDRVIGHGPYDDFLQTDASINPGNSGGPLFDASGNVVGINMAIVAGGTGIGFAVPINLAKELLPQLRQTGKVKRGWLGVGIQDLTDELAEKFGVAGKRGVLVSQVFEGSPAEKAGLRAGDIIVSINGRRVGETRKLTRRVGALSPGSKVNIQVIRERRAKKFTVKLAERESGEAVALGRSEKEPQEASLGLTLTPLTPEKARRLGVDERTRGLVVTGVDRKGPTAGFLRPGDLILEVNRRPVASLKEFQRALGKGQNTLLLVQRGSSQLFLVIQR
jgi:serine protease Do